MTQKFLRRTIEAIADTIGRTPLFIAAVRGHVETMRILLSTPEGKLSINNAAIKGNKLGLSYAKLRASLGLSGFY